MNYLWRKRETEEGRPCQEVAESQETRRRGSLSGLAWLPIPVLLAGMVGLWAADLRTAYEAPRLVIALNFLTRTLASLFIIYLAGRSFVAQRAPALLLMGCGVAIWGAAGFVTSAVGTANENFGITVTNLGAWLSGLCHLTGVVLSLRSKWTMRAAGVWLVGSYALIAGVVGLLAMAAFAGWLPLFFIDGQGGTQVRNVVLGSAIATFVLTAVLLWEGNRPSWSLFPYWYALALLVIAVGLLGMLIESARDTLLDWTCRATQYAGGIYLLMAGVASRRDSVAPRITLTRPLSAPGFRYGVAIAVVLAAAAVRIAFLPALEARAIFVTFYPAVTLAALYGGLRAGFLATLLSALVADYLWLKPMGHFSVRELGDWLSLAMFFAGGTMISWVTEAMRHAQSRATAAEAETKVAAEREQLLAERQRQGEFLEKLIDHAPIGVAVVGRDLRYRLANAAYRAIPGTSDTPVVGRTIAEVFPSVARVVESFVQRIFDTGQPLQIIAYEITLAPTREPSWWNVNAAPLRDACGNVEAVLIATQNVTAAKRAEREVFKTRQRLEALMRALPVGVSFSDDPTCQRITGNPAVLAQFEMGPADNLSASAPEASAPGRQVRYFRDGREISDDELPLQRAVAGKTEIPPMELEVVLPSGRRWFTDICGAPVWDEHGNVIGGVAVTVDISRRKRAEARLTANLDALTRMHALSGKLLGAMGLHPLLQEVMDAAVAIAGAERGTLQLLEGDSLRIVAQQGHRQPFLEFFACAESQPSVCGEALKRGERVVVPDIETCPLFAGTQALAVLREAGVRAVQSTRMVSRTGALLGILTTHWGSVHHPDEHDLWRIDLLARQAADLIEQARAEESLLEAKTAAERANAAKDHFLAVLSHELRTPLTPALAAAGMLTRDTRLPEEVRQDLEMIQQNIGLETRLIDDLLEVSHIASGKMMLRPEAADAAAILREAARMVAGDLEQRGLALSIDTPGAPYAMMGDSARLHQVFWNLLKNAIKYTPRGGHINVRCGRSDGPEPWLSVVVADDGMGIEREFLPEVFVPFSQGRRVLSGALGGLGLGLTVAKAVVEMHGGRIRVHSDGPGKGSSFMVELPLSAASWNPRQAGRSSAVHASNTGGAIDPLRILLVEDHPDTATMMARLLQLDGHAVTTAESVNGALAACKGAEFDILLSDLGLPDGTGYDLMRQLLAAGKKIAGVAVSGYGSAEDIQRSLAAGFVEHVTKPVSVDALQTALARVANAVR